MLSPVPNCASCFFCPSVHFYWISAVVGDFLKDFQLCSFMFLQMVSPVTFLPCVSLLYNFSWTSISKILTFIPELKSGQLCCNVSEFFPLERYFCTWIKHGKSAVMTRSCIKQQTPSFWAAGLFVAVHNMHSCAFINHHQGKKIFIYSE